MPGVTGEMRSLTDELRMLEDEVRKLRLNLAPMRNAYLALLKASLRAPSRAEARRALAAIAELEDALSVLNEFRSQVRRAGGVAPDLTPKMILPLAMLLQPIAGGTRQDRSKT